jgi:hypothetical protein
MRRPPDSGQIYEKWGSYYGRWRTPDGRRRVRLDGHTGFVEPTDSTRGEGASSIAGRDLGFSVDSVLVELAHLPTTLRSIEYGGPREATECRSVTTLTRRISVGRGGLAARLGLGPRTELASATGIVRHVAMRDGQSFMERPLTVDGAAITSPNSSPVRAARSGITIGSGPAPAASKEQRSGLRLNISTIVTVVANQRETTAR